MSTPQRIGRYEVRGRIGSGGFATVWRAYDGDLDNDVAVKILAENWIERSDIRSRFVEEARILRRADSDRVVRVHDIGTLDDGRPYFVMSYADLGTLAERIANGPLAVEEVLGYATSAARGVAILHDLGVLHRDVKPSNVLFRSTATGEQLMIADLGLAKAIAHASGFTVAAGTPGYMPPEQARTGGDIDRRVDVYALGALTYQMLTGSKPPSATSGELATTPSRVRPEVPADLDAIVMRALERDRSLRWHDAAAFADATSDALRALPGADAPPVSAPSQPSGGSGPPPVYGAPQAPATPTVTPTTQATHQTAPSTPAPTTAPHAGGVPYPAPPPLQEHPSFPGQRVPAGRQPTPGERGRRSKRWAVVTASFLVLLLAGVGVLVWSQLRPTTIVTPDRSITAQVPQEWVPSTPTSNSPENLEPFGKPGEVGTRLTTQSDFDTLESAPGITIVASKSFNDLSAAVFGEQAPPTDMWDPAGCDEPVTTKLTPANFTDGQLRTWPGCSGGQVYGQAVLHGKGYGAQVFMVQNAGEDEFGDVLDSVEVDGGKLP